MLRVAGLSTHRARAGLAVALAATIIAGALADRGAAQSSAVERNRAEVQRIQGELAAVDARLEDAANEYNGARYRLGGIREDIQTNKRTLNATEKALAVSRVRLAERLRSLYASPQPNFAEILLTSGSLAEVNDRLELLDVISQRDGAVVSGIRASRVRLKVTRQKLVEDQAQAQSEVEAADAKRRDVERLLGRRRAVLDQAQGELAAALRAEEERRDRVAAQQQAVAVARQRVESSGSTSAAPSATPQAPGAPLPSGSGNAAVVGIALQYLGVPYRWGGASPSGFDCSGLASYAYGQIGRSVPHYTVAIWNAFPKVPRDQLQPGDLVFYRGLGHMGVYIGGNQYVHAPQTGDVVKISSLDARGDYVGAVRP